MKNKIRQWLLPGLLIMGALTAEADTQASLDAIFADKACTVLSEKFRSMSEADIRGSAEFAALPSPLQSMVIKVKSGDWSEAAGAAGLPAWDSSHARKYRVQLYEPYSEGMAVSKMLSCKPHTNLNNPTGLTVKPGDKLYIMVEGKVADGATLYYGEVPGRLLIENMDAVNNMSNVKSGGKPLREGLNVIAATGNKATPYIYYAVDTYNTSTGAKGSPLSAHRPLKIHIEGGSVSGFFNNIGDELYTPDTKADFDYTLARSVSPDYTFVGDAAINIYPADKGPGLTTADGKQYPALRDVVDSTFDPVAMMRHWDEMVSVVRVGSGLKGVRSLPAGSPLREYFTDISDDDIAPVATDDYINNRLLNVFMPDVAGVAMWSTHWYNGMCAYGFRDIVYGMCDTGDGTVLWGPTHEYGHSVQDPINLPSATEVSNNLYSNVGLFLMGTITSRADYMSSAMHYFNKRIPWADPAQSGGGNYPDRIWSNTRMYFQLWLYYHQQKHNTKFLMRLNELLRRNPLNGTGADFTNFYKQACVAAQEDLTDFFDAWCLLLPMDNLVIEDYGTKCLTLTRAQIDAAKAEVAAMNLPKNRQIIFIDDRPGSPKAPHPDWPKEKAGDLGGLADFAAGTKSDGAYRYDIEKGGVRVKDGKGGVGFALYSRDSRLLGFSNTLAMPLNTEALAALVDGTAKLCSVDADGTLKEISADTETEKKGLRDNLLAALARADAILALTSPDDDIPGYFFSEYTAPAALLAEEARRVYNDAASTAADYGKAFIALAEALDALESHPLARKPVSDGAVFAFDNAGYPGTALAADAVSAISARYNKSDKSQLWTLERAGAAYYVRNKATGKYITATASQSAQVKMGTSPASFKLTLKPNGTYVLTETGNSYSSIHVDAAGKVVSWWETDNIHSQWIMHEVEADPAAVAANTLERALYDLDATIALAGDVTMTTEPVSLSADRSFFTNAACRVPGPDLFTSWDVLTDDDPSTYFHTDWSGADSDDGRDHYLAVDLGEGNATDAFVFSYTNRAYGSVHAPRRIVVETGPDRKHLTLATVIDNIEVAAPGSLFTSRPISLSGPARIIRLTVTANSSGGSAGGHPFFVISGFGLAVPSYTALPSPAYPDVTESLLLASKQTSDRGRQTVSCGDVPAIDAATAEVRAARAALLEAMTNTSGIDGATAAPDAADTARKGIFDLQGRRLRSADRPGIYIVDGRKTVVR